MKYARTYNEQWLYISYYMYMYMIVHVSKPVNLYEYAIATNSELKNNANRWGRSIDCNVNSF